MLYNSYNLEVLIKDLTSVISLLFDAQQWVFAKYIQNGPNHQL